MKRILVVITLTLFLTSGCSDTESVYVKNGACYSRYDQRILGLRYQTNQYSESPEFCREGKYEHG